MTIRIGDTVRRDTSDKSYSEEMGVVIEIDKALSRARIKWTEKRTWYKISKLIHVKSSNENPT